MIGRRQPIRMPSLEPKPEISHGMRRLAGLLVFTLGVGLLADALRSLIVEDATLRTMVWLGAFVLPVCLLAVTFGWRLMLNRPNPYGSIMGPTAWRISGLLILLGTGFAAVVQLKGGAGVSWRLLGFLFFAGACIAKAEYMVRRGEITWGRSARP